MTLTTASARSGTKHDRALSAVEDRVLWLATPIVTVRIADGQHGRADGHADGQKLPEPPK
jgi:hypothetical protein